MDKRTKDFLLVAGGYTLICGIRAGLQAYHITKERKRVEAITRAVDKLPEQFKQLEEERVMRLNEKLAELNESCKNSIDHAKRQVSTDWIFDPSVSEEEQHRRFEEAMYDDDVQVVFDFE